MYCIALDSCHRQHYLNILTADNLRLDQHDNNTVEVPPGVSQTFD